MDTSVYISNENIQVVVGKFTGRCISLKSCISQKLPEFSILNGIITNDEILRNAIEDMWLKYSLSQRNIKLLIDGTFINTKAVQVPKTNSDNILAIIKNEFSDIESTNELLYDYSVINPKCPEGGSVILGCAVEKPLIAAYLDIFQPLKVDISSINLTLNSCIKLTKFLDFLKNKTYAIAALDGNNIVVTLFVNGTYKISNRYRIIEERGTIQSVDEITHILSNMIQFNKSEKSGFDISDIYFCGIHENESKLCETISSLLELNVSEIPDCKSLFCNPTKEKETIDFKLSDYFYSIGNLI